MSEYCRVGSRRTETQWRASEAIKLVALLLSASLFVANTASAQSDTAVERLTQSLSERVEFDVSGYQIIGENPIGAAKIKAILAPYIGSKRGIDDIENAAGALEEQMSAEGLSFYRVSFPPQELTDGVVDLLITRYRIGSINVKGNNFYSKRNIQSSLPLLKQGESPSTKGIARALRVANQNSGKRVRVTLAPGSGVNEIDANIMVRDQKPLVLTSWLNNTGTESSGDYRVGASIEHRNIFALDHNGSLTFITSPEGINDVKQIAASYRIPLYTLGGALNFVAVNSDIDTGVVADVFDVAGRGEVYGIGYSHVLSSIGLYNHGVLLQVQDKLFDNDVQFQGRQVLEDVRSRPLEATYQASWSNGEGVELSGSVSATSNMSGGSFNNARSYGVSRAGATDDWTKFELGANYQYKAKEWLYTASLAIVISDDRLITGEQFAVGGVGSVRGLEERELRGDEGYQVSIQAWAPPISSTLRPVAFVDIGHVSNNGPIDGEFGSEDVMSIGMLLNWNPTNKISASASYGYLIDGVDSEEAIESSPEDGDGQLHFNLTYRF
ncbi:MAG: hemolysin activation/secretion protein [Arenicella sp.]|jgi:hemolysin activation/secretion protein